MIQIYNPFNKLLGSGDTSASGAVDARRKEAVMVYIDYQKGSEDNITITFDTYEKNIGDWFPVQQDDGTNWIIYSRTLTEGKYRMPIPVSLNEEQIRINVDMNGSDLSSPGTVKVWLFPNSYLL